MRDRERTVQTPFTDDSEGEEQRGLGLKSMTLLRPL